MKKYDDPRDFLRQIANGDITKASDTELQQLASDIVDILAAEDGIKIPPGNDELVEGLKQSVYESIRGILAEAPPKEPEKRRTASDARKMGAVKGAGLPTALAIPTIDNYVNSMSLYEDGNAYLQLFTSTDGLTFKKGKLYFDTCDTMREISEMELQNLKTKEGIESIDLPLLRVFYSIVLKQFELTKYREIKPQITLYVPDLAEILGMPRNINGDRLTTILQKVQSFHNMVGVSYMERNGKQRPSYYPVLNFEGYNDKTNTITISSPYMNHLIATIYKVSIRRDKNGKAKLKKNGDPLRLASHSYLINSDISLERNKAAVENVFIIVQLIERAGENVPRIKASTLIERNPQLQDRLENHSNKRLLLKRVFSKTWELLRTKTRLTEFYKDIRLPDPTDPAYLPNETELDKLVISFPHDGKINPDIL